MTLRQFIRENREEIDSHLPDYAPRNDKERELWILNDEGLYSWAKAQGVRNI